MQRYWYDANGNVTRRITPWGTDITLSYDAENRLTGVSGSAIASYVYDGDGNRVKATVNGITSVYVGNYYEVTGGVVKKYYYAGDTRVAENSDGTLYWLLTDHLGGTNVTLTASGTYSTELRYYPYGYARYNAGNQATTYRYTGQRWDPGTGLYFYGARWYDPVIGRFIQPDTIVPEPENPQALNRYAYVNNNPLKYTDPTGHYISLEDDFGVRVTRTGVVQVVRGGSHFANPVEVALANAILSGETRHLETIPADTRPWALQHSLDHVASELGYGGSAGAAGDLLLDPMVAFGLAFGMVKAAERGEILPAESIPAGERLGYTETPWDATARGGTYRLIDPTTGEVQYVGRTNNLARRRAEHALDPIKGQLRFQVDWMTDDYVVRRGREQMLYDLYRPPLNRIRPISPRNPYLQEYLDAARRFGEMMR